jgi:fermentation-respiration switch protein FrsA (DUF1100 family)
MNPLTLSVTPPEALIDEPRQIVLTHAAPGETVTIATRTIRFGGVVWESRATFTADAQGSLDIARAVPTSGDYAGISPMGLIWSQQPLKKGSREVFADRVTDPLITVLTATAASGAEVRAELVQRLTAAGVSRQEIRDDGLVGTLFMPTGHGPHPAVIVLNGSNGGINEPRAALYASRGFAAFALGYFRAPGLSDFISNTPLEYFKKAMDWVRRHVRPAQDFVALSGQSRGGELVLLLGTVFPEAVSAVVAYVPGAVVHSGQNAADPKVGREGPAWLLGGRPIPHVWENNRYATWKPFDEGPPPHRFELAVLTALQDADAVARARIRVEKIQGPVMCLSGTDDGSWPSSRYSKMVCDALQVAHHPHPVQWLDFKDAGHSILFPYVPTTQLIYTHPVSGRISTGGGNPSANAVANEQSWAGVQKFLKDTVARRAAQAG